MGSLTLKTTHVVEALARLKEQFKDKDVIEAIVSIFAGRIQTIENDIWDAFEMQLLENASDGLLDRLGSIVGQPRLAFTDEEYRLTIAGRIRANRSNGTVEAMLGVLVAVAPTITWELIEDDLAAYTVEGDEPLTVALAKVIAALLDVATPVGVRGLFMWQELEDADTFTLAIGTAMSAGETAGATTIDVADTSLFPATGTLMYSAGTALEETKVYSAKTSTTFTSAALANTHPAGAMVTLVDGVGLGFPVAIPLTGTEAIGETVLTVSDTTGGFTATGDLEIDEGTSIAEDRSYAAKDGTTFTVGVATAYQHIAGSMLTQGGGGLANTEKV